MFRITPSMDLDKLRDAIKLISCEMSGKLVTELTGLPDETVTRLIYKIWCEPDSRFLKFNFRKPVYANKNQVLTRYNHLHSQLVLSHALKLRGLRKIDQIVTIYETYCETNKDVLLTVDDVHFLVSELESGSNNIKKCKCGSVFHNLGEEARRTCVVCSSTFLAPIGKKTRKRKVLRTERIKKLVDDIYQYELAKRLTLYGCRAVAVVQITGLTKQQCHLLRSELDVPAVRDGISYSIKWCTQNEENRLHTSLIYRIYMTLKNDSKSIAEVLLEIYEYYLLVAGEDAKSIDHVRVLLGALSNKIYTPTFCRVCHSIVFEKRAGSHTHGCTVCNAIATRTNARLKMEILKEENLHAISA